MKKFLLTIIVFVATLFACVLSSCSVIRWLADDWLTVNQKEVTDAAMQRLCSAIADNDAEAVKAQFSYDDIKDVEDFDGQVQKLINYIEGENISFNRKASGSDGAAMGGYPREREFGGVRYEINTSTDSYKVIFSYRSYYSEGVNKITAEKIGFTHFDIINVKNDRYCPDRLYSGCPFYYNGINFDYRTDYIFCPEEYGCQIAFCENLPAFDPVIVNDAQTLNLYYDTHKDEYSLESRADGKGFKDVADKYDEEFFAGHSLYIAGISGDGVEYKYVPQFLYIGDFVLVNVVGFEDTYNRDEDKSEYTAGGLMLFIELPEKVSYDIPTMLDLSHNN